MTTTHTALVDRPTAADATVPGPQDDIGQKNKPHRSKRRVALIVLVAVFGLVAGLLAVSASYEAYASARDRRDHPAPGEIVELAESRIHVLATGPADPDEPTVVLLPGATSMSTVWAHVQADLDDDLRVVAYDRPGLAWSERHGEAVDAVSQVDLLVDVLDVAGEEPPFVLVGHSLGGAHARVFAARYPDLTAGLILVDALHPDIWDAMTPADVDEQQQFVDRAQHLPTMARTGLLRLMNPFATTAEGLPDDVVDGVVARSLQIRHLETAADELDQLRPTTATVEQLVAADADLPAIPVAVITRGDDHSTTPAQQATDAAFAERHDGTQTVVADADHTQLLTDVDHAAVVADAVRDIALR